MAEGPGAELASRIRVILVGIGGATCSGKTTLAKHLKKCIPNSIIVHQDDFAPPQDLVPYHPQYGVQDWDDPPGAIDWPRLRSFLRDVKKTGEIPLEHHSHDHLNEQKDVPVDSEIFSEWRTKFVDLKKAIEKNGEKVVVGLLDGFLLYWDQEVIDDIDAKLLLRVPHDVLKQRRHERHGYHTAVQSDPEGSLWRDPPLYWEQIVYPAYVRAHERLMTNGDVEDGEPNGAIPDLIVMDSYRTKMSDVFAKACGVVYEALKVKESKKAETLTNGTS